jgi:hypothetical protein
VAVENLYSHPTISPVGGSPVTPGSSERDKLKITIIPAYASRRLNMAYLGAGLIFTQIPGD